jgi:hypothetical protein
MNRILGGGVLVTLLSATLVGCSVAVPNPGESATPTSAATSSATTSPSGEVGGGHDSGQTLAAYIAADTTSLRIGPVGEGGQETVYDYYEDSPADVVEALTQALGFAPYIYESSASVTIYEWSGFQLLDLAGPGAFPDPPDFYLRVFTNEVSGVPVLLGETGRVGGSLSDIAGDVVDAAGPCTSSPCSYLTIAFAVPLDPQDAGLAPGDPAPYNGTLVYSSGPDGPITSFLTPERRW